MFASNHRFEIWLFHNSCNPSLFKDKAYGKNIIAKSEKSLGFPKTIYISMLRKNFCIFQFGFTLICCILSVTFSSLKISQCIVSKIEATYSTLIHSDEAECAETVCLILLLSALFRLIFNQPSLYCRLCGTCTF